MKRYESYKEVNLPWLKEVPSHWGVDRAKNHFNYEKLLNKNNIEKNILSLTLKGVIRNNIDNPIGLSPSNYSTYQLFKTGDLVFKLIDLNNIKTSRVGLVFEDGAMSSAYIRLFKKNGNYSEKYFYYWYFKLYIEEVFNKLGSGVRETIGKDELLALEIPIPPLQEQQKIASFLDWKISEIDKLIAKEKEKIKELKNLYHKLISKKMNNLERINLKFLLSENLKYGLNLSGDIKGQYRFVRITDIDLEGNLKNDNKQFVDCSDRTFILNKGDILFARSGATAGKTFLFSSDEESVFAGYLIKAKVDERKVLPEFLYLYTQSEDYNNWKSSIFIQSTIQNISAEKYNYLKVPITDLDTQHRIITELTTIKQKIDNVILNNKTQIQNLESLKQSLIAEVVTGQIDVRDVVIPEYEKFTLEVDELEEEVEENE